MTTDDMIVLSILLTALLIWVTFLVLTILAIRSVIKKALQKANINFLGAAFVHSERPYAYYAIAVFRILTSIIPIALFTLLSMRILLMLGASGV